MYNFTKEKRAQLQRQAYGKVYAYCSECYMPLIPISKVNIGKDNLIKDHFIPCCDNGLILFGDNYKMDKLSESETV